LIFTNPRLIFPNEIRDGLELVAREGKIIAIREQTRLRSPRRPTARQAQAPREEIVDLARNYLAPGFIDLHVHGALGRDTMESSAEALRAICHFHASGGTTSLLLTTATAPIENIVGVLNTVRDCVDRRARQSRPTIGQIAGVHV